MHKNWFRQEVRSKMLAIWASGIMRISPNLKNNSEIQYNDNSFPKHPSVFSFHFGVPNFNYYVFSGS